MNKMTSRSRKYEALDIVGLSKLTAKQYLVYAYLMSISIWNAQEQEGHYYVYKNSFTVKDSSALLNISENTWRTAIRELRKQGYIWYECEPEDEDIPFKNRKMKEKKGTKYYIINFPEAYIPLDIQLIKVLVQYGASLSVGGSGGTIVSVYSMICRYYDYCQSKPDGDTGCYLNIGQIRKVFCQRRTEENGNIYRTMIAIFQFLELVEVKTTKKFYKGKDYTQYEFINPQLKLNPKFYLDESEGPENINDILKAIKSEIQEENEGFIESTH